MTREEMKELNGLAASMGLYDDKNPCKRAVILGKAIKELEQEPTTKNDLGVDIDKLIDDCEKMSFDFELFGRPTKALLLDTVKNIVKDLPSVTPQEPFKPMVEIDLYSVIKQKYIEREVLDKIRAEIEKQEKWLLQAGYNTYNVDIAFNSIKLALAESEDKG